MAVTVISRMYAKSNQGDSFQEAFESAQQIVERQPGNLGVEGFRQIEDSDTFIFHVQWASTEAHHAFVASEDFQALRAALKPFRADQPLDTAHYTTFIGNQ